jgi:integrase
MVQSSAYLDISRHGVFFFRIRVPKSLLEVFPSSHVRRSLHTKYRREAVQRGAVLLKQVWCMFDDAAAGKAISLSGLSWEQTEQHTRTVPVGQSQPIVEPISKSPTLTDVLDEYLAEQARDGVGVGTMKGKRTATSALKRIVGDKTIDQYTREDARLFKDQALKLPPRFLLLPDQPLERIISEATDTISTTTFNNYMKNLTTVFIFAVREGHCDRNPFDGLKVKSKVRARDYRSRFTDEDIKTLFSQLSRDAYLETKPYRKWLPLLGLYTGARMNELCQLYLDDVVQIDGIDCLHIRAGRPDQSLKNANSERLIPIHSQLLKLGFLEFVNSQRVIGCERLFQELTYHNCHHYTHAPSRWFANVRAKAGFKNSIEKKDFHSLRHTVADHLKQLDASESLIAGLLGHQSGGITFGRYGKDYKPEKLVRLIELLKFNAS